MTDQIPLDHIARPPLPWRDIAKTECGRALTDVASVVSREDVERKIARQGKQRAALTTCMTCATTSGRWPAWDRDPIEAMGRAVNAARYDEADPLRRELRAIAMLIEAHRDEFDSLIAGLESTSDLSERRRANRMRGR